MTFNATQVDSIDVLLSQKPFWRCFSSPKSLLILQLFSMQFVADVHVEQTSLAALQGKGNGKGGELINFEEILDTVKERIEVSEARGVTSGGLGPLFVPMRR